jgi:CHAT domain-containing protein/tetratricopeptide (TPR) repeat protein
MKHKSKSLVYLLALALISTIIPGNPMMRGASAETSRGSIPTPPPAQQATQAAQALKQGRVLLKRGKADQALSSLQNALNLFKAAGNSKGVAASNDALGDLYVRQGQYNVALQYYQSAHDAFVEAVSKQGALETTLGMPDNEFNANLMLAKMGETNFRMGKVSEASSAYGQMKVVKPDPSKLTGGVNVKKSGGGILGGGGGLLGRVTGGASSATGAADTAMGVAGAIKGAVELYRQNIIYSTHELGVGRIDYVNNSLDSSKKHFEEALATAGMAIIGKFGQSRRVRAAARTSLGDIALRQNNLKDAVKYYGDAVKGAREDKRLDLMWPAQRGLGKARWLQASLEKDPKKGQKGRDEAVASYREALQTIETIREGGLRADEARTTFLATTKDVYDETSSNLAEMALLSSPSAGAPLDGQALAYAAEAFKVVEQGRARSLLDMLGESGADITEGVPADLLKRKQDNLDRQQEIAQQLTGVTPVAEGEEKPDTGKLEAELETLSTDYDNIENQIRAASPKYASLTAPQPLTLSEVQQKVLDDKTALLEYSLGDERSYLWAVTPTSVALFKLPTRSAVAQQAQDLRAALIPPKLQRRIVGIDVADAQRGLGLSSDPAALSGVAAQFATASNALYKTAVEPAAKIVGDRRLLVVADGALNYVPFEAFVTATSGTDYSTLPYLVKTNEVVYAPSASVVAIIRQGAVRPAGKNLLLVADPVFNASDPRARGAAAGGSSSADTRGLSLSSAVTDVAGAPAGGPTPVGGLQLLRLNGTRTEAEQIARLTRASGGQADVWLDLDANEANMTTRDIKKYRVIHIATHGLLNAERPQFTGIVLSLVGNKSGDGFLRTDEVFNLNLGGSLVMLSACETGLGKEKRGEGVIGLTRAFMYAGAPTVGVSLWSVADKSTADLMTDFYKRLLATPDASPTASMRAAQVAMIDGKKYSAPFYWAPFVLVGEWR